jgi:hypothetical protein
LVVKNRPGRGLVQRVVAMELVVLAVAPRVAVAAAWLRSAGRGES